VSDEQRPERPGEEAELIAFPSAPARADARDGISIDHLEGNRSLIVRRSLLASAVGGLVPLPVMDDYLAGRVRAGMLMQLAERRRVDILPSSAELPLARGLSAPLSCLNEARYGIVWGAMGAARSAFEAALEYAKARTQFGKPIGGFQLTQAKLVDMAVELNKGLLLALHLGRRKDAGTLAAEQVSFGKLNNTRAALDICRTARGVLGANGISLEFPVIRHMANLESVLTYEGTVEMHTLVLGQALTGLAAFR